MHPGLKRLSDASLERSLRYMGGRDGTGFPTHRDVAWARLWEQLKPTRFDRLGDVTRHGLPNRQHTLLHSFWNALRIECAGHPAFDAVKGVMEFTGAADQLDFLEEQISSFDFEKAPASFFAQIAPIAKPTDCPSECLRPWKDDEHPLPTPYACLSCGTIKDVKLIAARTMYDTTCFTRFDFICRIGEENPNAPNPFCPPCAAEYNSQWDEQWNEYYYSLM